MDQLSASGQTDSAVMAAKEAYGLSENAYKRYITQYIDTTKDP
jgi:hypothetical protein